MNTKVTPCAHGTASAFEKWWDEYHQTISTFTAEKQIACDAYAAGMADPMVSPKTVEPCCGKYETCTQACTPRGKFIGKREAESKCCTQDCNQGRTCPARKNNPPSIPLSGTL